MQTSERHVANQDVKRTRRSTPARRDFGSVRSPGSLSSLSEILSSFRAATILNFFFAGSSVAVVLAVSTPAPMAEVAVGLASMVVSSGGGLPPSSCKSTFISAGVVLGILRWRRHSSISVSLISRSCSENGWILGRWGPTPGFGGAVLLRAAARVWHHFPPLDNRKPRHQRKITLMSSLSGLNEEVLEEAPGNLHIDISRSLG